jgi:hypothetical protein
LANSSASVLAPVTASSHHGRCLSADLDTMDQVGLAEHTDEIPAASTTGRALTSCCASSRIPRRHLYQDRP